MYKERWSLVLGSQVWINSCYLIARPGMLCKVGVAWRIRVRGFAKDPPKVLRFSIDINSCFIDNREIVIYTDS